MKHRRIKNSLIIFYLTIFMVNGCGSKIQLSQPPNIHLEKIADEEKTYISIEDYGTIEEKQQEFVNEDGELVYYYTMEEFFLKDTLPNAEAVNYTLQQIYDEYELAYSENAQIYQSGEGAFGTPYCFWHMLEITYIGEDYISILYNDVSYMGGAHPYSSFDGITIDWKTGEQILASRISGKSDEEILTEISNSMGLEGVATWEDIDFYLTDSTIVFFYRMPGFWEEVTLQREN